MPAIQLSSLTKTFGTKLAVDRLDMTIDEGSLIGLIGPNGAGKTTTIRMVMSIIFPDSGQIRVLGRESALESKDRIGYLPEERGVYKKMRVGEFLTYIARLKGVDASATENLVRGWLEKVGLPEVYRKKCEELSKGMQQKIQFIAAVIHKPDMVILDEPFSGLDPVNRKLLRSLIDEQHREGRTIIFSTHAMFEAESLCDQIFMIHNGRKVLDGSLQQITARYDNRSLLLEPVGDTREAADRLADLGQVQAVAGTGSSRGVLELLLPDGADAQGAMAAALGRVALRRIEIKRVSLEEVFIELVERTSGERLDRSVLAAGGVAAESGAEGGE